MTRSRVQVQEIGVAQDEREAVLALRAHGLAARNAERFVQRILCALRLVGGAEHGRPAERALRLRTQTAAGLHRLARAEPAQRARCCGRRGLAQRADLRALDRRSGAGTGGEVVCGVRATPPGRAPVFAGAAAPGESCASLNLG